MSRVRTSRKHIMSTSHYIASTITAASTFIGFYVLSYHSSVYYKNFQHGNTNPAQSASSKTQSKNYIERFTLIDVVIAFLYSLTLTINVFFANASNCKALLGIGVALVGVSKLFVYAVFALRLHVTYGGTQYGVSPSILKGVIIFLTVYWVTYLIILSVIGIDQEINGFDATFIDKGEYTQCFFAVPGWAVILWGFFDIVVNIWYCILFVKPIRQLITQLKLKQQNEQAQQQQQEKDGSHVHVAEKELQHVKMEKMIRIGLKVAILSVILLVSTIVITLLYGLSINISSLDSVINAICLVLMSRLYHDNRIFHKVCCLCVFCCDHNGYTAVTADQENGSQRENTDAPDTIKAIRETALQNN